MIYKFFDKKILGSGVATSTNEQLSKELNKVITGNLKKSIFNI